MWSTIGLATARQLSVGGRLSIRRAARPTARIAGRDLAPIPCGLRVAAVFGGRSFAATPRRLESSAAEAKTADESEAKSKTKTKAPGKKKTAPKKAAAKKASGTERASLPKKDRKVLTEEEITKLKVRQLRKQALKAPKRLPDNSWLVFLSHSFKTTKNEREAAVKAGQRLDMTTITRELCNAFKALPAAELEKLKAEARENYVANEIAYKAWIQSHSPEEIKRANRARSMLKNVYKKKNIGYDIPDDRIPKNPRSSFLHYCGTRLNSPEFAHLKSQEVMSKLGEEWRNLSDTERQPFVDKMKSEYEEWRKQRDAVLAKAAAPV